jgi:Family of unknown function (DUF5335)
MAKGSRQIPRSEWRQYFDDFSRNLPALVASIEVDGPETGAQIEAERGLLTGISYDDRDDIVVIVLDAPGGTREDLERNVSQPQQIYVADDEAGETVVDIEDAEGNKTLVRIEPAPALPPS